MMGGREPTAPNAVASMAVRRTNFATKVNALVNRGALVCRSAARFSPAQEDVASTASAAMAPASAMQASQEITARRERAQPALLAWMKPTMSFHSSALATGSASRAHASVRTAFAALIALGALARMTAPGKADVASTACALATQDGSDLTVHYPLAFATALATGRAKSPRRIGSRPTLPKRFANVTPAGEGSDVSCLHARDQAVLMVARHAVAKGAWSAMATGRAPLMACASASLLGTEPHANSLDAGRTAAAHMAVACKLALRSLLVAAKQGGVVLTAA